MLTFEELKQHIGHNVVVVNYGALDNIWNIAIECEDCNEVLMDLNPGESAARENDREED